MKRNTRQMYQDRWRKRISKTEKYMHELQSQQREAMTKIENLIGFTRKQASGQ